ncbi:glutamine--tRNA ligase [Candidatus Karelsulcia muelleri]|uniref:glutamine--tRNA ligase n=1 Tax=Candidatus Karelsulcia muelleri TaxID=336810 RepID=UPI002363E157|nr:glutamine--tRNA ligase [Candidatus Karelsulcia muelleri]WDE42153.1 glutamine--tRNA ligase [Candidatus Karelsulcia muelleri]WDR79142.1 glutamine--tRNA ligase [Candidatus Karelsulcia muelleri]
MSKTNFLEKIIDKDIKNGLPKKNLSFRFPPEPNGFLHLGHVKSIYLNYSLARKYKCPFILRFDDTNPINEETKFIKAIKKDINWLGFKWCKETYASDYFVELYKLAKKLILQGKAFVDSQTKKKIKEQRRSSYEDGIESPYRKRSIYENLELFKKMKNGCFKEGECVLRAKIDMNSPNINLRDPIMYRIIKKKHYKTGKKWFIYPTYDWAHGQNDYLEKISHSLCTLEFQHNKPLYNWFLSKIKSSGHILPKQYEFSRLNLNYSIMSKTKIKFLIEKQIVENWDDPRLPTISGLRRRGFTPDAICKFIKEIGISKRENNIDIYLLEFYLKKNLAKIAEQVMVVFNPLTLKIENLNETKWLRFKDRNIPFSKEIYIESKDFIENKKDKFWRLSIGQKVRLKSAFTIKAKSIIKKKNGSIKYILCKIYKDKSKYKATLHWVAKKYSLPIKINLYGKLFNIKCPEKIKNFTDYINKKSRIQVNAFAEQFLRNANSKTKYQFLRNGYFCLDNKSTKKNNRKLVFNKIISLKQKRFNI